MALAVRYALFAVLATVLNLLGQMAGFRLLPAEYAVFGGMLVGTAVGLVSKYWLDKRYIFRFRSAGLQAEGRLFLLYSAFGAAMTLLFWATEWLFHLLFASEPMRYVGAVAGLSVGYFLKYHLDAKFVFVQRAGVSSPLAATHSGPPGS